MSSVTDNDSGSADNAVNDPNVHFDHFLFVFVCPEEKSVLLLQSSSHVSSFSLPTLKETQNQSWKSVAGRAIKMVINKTHHFVVHSSLILKPK